MKWTKSGFDEFRKGTFGNGGQNLYVTASGTLQRIFNFDVNGDGYPDIPIANSHSMNEKPEIYIYDEIGQKKPLKLPTNGAFDAIFADLNGNGTEDLVVACQHNGVHSDVTAIVYFGSELGLCEKYKTELTVPCAFGVGIGDFNGNGKKDLIFNSNSTIRLFPLTDLGYQASVSETIEIKAVSMAVGDFDGDGYDDLYVINPGTLDNAIYWGSEKGLDPENKTVFGKELKMSDSAFTSTTAGRMLMRWMPWTTNAVSIKGKQMVFRAETEDAVFESFDKDRCVKEEFRFHIFDLDKVEHEMNKNRYEGVMYATVGDLKSCGGEDIIIAHSTGCDYVDDLIILWDSENYDMAKATRIPVRAAHTMTVAPVEEGGKNYLFVCLGGEEDILQVTHEVYSFDEKGTPSKVWEIPAMEASKIITGKTYTDGRYQIAVINHEGEAKLGLENVWVYLGGEDGYNADRKIALPGCAAVDCVPLNMKDSGNPELLVVTCAENAPHLDPGATIYFSDENGFDKNNKFSFDTILAHGVAVGDFRHSGYLDFAFAGIRNREMRLFEGGPDGYTMKKIVFGPHPETFVPFPWDEAGKDPDYSEEENKLIVDFGNVRWMHAADYNGDGYLDIFVSQIGGKNSFILWGGPEGYSTERMQILATDGVSAANAADLDGDGYLDLVVACHQTKGHKIANEKGKYVIYWGGPNGFEEHRKSQLPTYCSNALTIQDFNGDGLLDIYGTAYTNGRCRDIDSVMYFQGQDRMFHYDDKQYIFNHSGCGCLAGDFNGDGYIDLAVASHKNDGNHVNESYIFWGGEDGINEQRYTPLPCRGPHGMCSVDIGNIMDRSDSEYYTSEAYESSTKALKIEWKAENAQKTWVKVQLRCADSLEALENAEWSESFENGADISDLNLKGFVQYKLELGAKCGCGSPRVTEVTVDFE